MTEDETMGLPKVCVESNCDCTEFHPLRLTPRQEIERICAKLFHDDLTIDQATKILTVLMNQQVREAERRVWKECSVWVGQQIDTRLKRLCLTEGQVKILLEIAGEFRRRSRAQLEGHEKTS